MFTDCCTVTERDCHAKVVLETALVQFVDEVVYELNTRLVKRFAHMQYD